MILQFDKGKGLIHVLQRAATYPAGNVVDTRAQGDWPLGVFPREIRVPVPGVDGLPDGKFGAYFFGFAVSGRTGMGVHAGREGRKDGAGREGVNHATFGCIRTTDGGVRGIWDVSVIDPASHLIVTKGEA
jgi:hypothetical protein